MDFDKYTVCFYYSLLAFICGQRNRPDCKYLILLFHSCWVTISLDTLYGKDVIRLLGGQDVLFNPDGADLTCCLVWLGKKRHLFSLEASNVAYFPYH